jgi:2-haloacid dehalogenase
MIRGLLLDFYGTVVEAIAARVAAGAQRNPAGQVRAAWEREFAAVASGPDFVPLRQCSPVSLATVMAEVGCAGDPLSWCAPQFAYWRAPALRAGTREFLERVKLPICIVSDVDRDDLAAAAAHLGLTFTAIVTSEDVGAYKPSPAMFARGLAALSLDAGDVLHVGDSWHADIRGAHAAGIRAAWVNRRGRAAPGDVPIAHEITRLSDLIPILDHRP